MADYDLQYQDTHIDALLATANELKTAGYIYKGVATPSTNPGTPTERVAYLASEPGTYTNFGGIVITSGLYSLTYAGGTWTGTQMQAGSDIEVVQTTGQSASDVMSQKAVTDALDDVGLAVDDITHFQGSSLEIKDESENVLAVFKDGWFKTQKFNSEDVPLIMDGTTPLDIKDDNDYVLVRFEGGHIKTRNFDSSNIANLIHTNLYQKKMCAIGDSYVANHNQSYTLTWHYLIAQDNEMTYVNYGINGNGLVATASPAIGIPVVNRYTDMDDDADYVIVVGGKNDYNAQLSIANFKTGLATLCAGLINKYAARGTRIAFFTPWDDYDSGTDPNAIKLIEYVDAIIEVCGKYSIPVFDSSRKSSMYMFNATFRSTYCQSSTDISHLNANGHKLFKNKAFNFLNQL